MVHVRFHVVVYRLSWFLLRCRPPMPPMGATRRPFPSPCRGIRRSVPGLCVTGPGLEESCLEAANGTHPIITGYTELLRGVMEEKGRECDFFTVLRHPIDRLVSAFFYCPEHDPQNRPKKW